MERTSKKQQQDYIWYVSCPEHGPTEVRAADKLSAVIAAAREWELRWTAIAAACDVVRMRKAVD